MANALPYPIVVDTRFPESPRSIKKVPTRAPPPPPPPPQSRSEDRYLTSSDDSDSDARISPIQAIPTYTLSPAISATESPLELRKTEFAFTLTNERGDDSVLRAPSAPKMPPMGLRVNSYPSLVPGVTLPSRFQENLYEEPESTENVSSEPRRPEQRHTRSKTDPPARSTANPYVVMALHSDTPIVAPPPTLFARPKPAPYTKPPPPIQQRFGAAAALRRRSIDPLTARLHQLTHGQIDHPDPDNALSPPSSRSGSPLASSDEEEEKESIWKRMLGADAGKMGLPGDKTKNLFGRFRRHRKETSEDSEEAYAGSMLGDDIELNDAAEKRSFVSERTTSSGVSNEFLADKDRSSSSSHPIAIKVKAYHKPDRDFDRLTRLQVLGVPLGASARSTPVTPQLPTINLETQSISGSSFATSPSGNVAEPDAAEVMGPIWCLKFSKDGKYLAAGGQDGVLRVWVLTAADEERSRATPSPESPETGSRFSDVSRLGNIHYHGQHPPVWRALGKRDSMESFKTTDSFRTAVSFEQLGSVTSLSTPHFSPETHLPFRPRPFRTYRGHTAPILDLSWSRNNFIATASMDKMVRLWHIARPECLCCFRHPDVVTGVQFHPFDDRYILTGSLDSKVRIWSVSEKRVAHWNEAPNGSYVTAVAFTSDGSMAIAGTYNGDCIFYEFDGLKYNTQIQVKSSKGRNAKARKITGIEVIRPSVLGDVTEERVIITSNDSRVRVYNLRDKSLYRKFKGCENRGSQIRATGSEDGRWIVSGSEEGGVYIWTTNFQQPGTVGTDGYSQVYGGVLGLSGFMAWQGGEGGRSDAFERFVGSDGAVTCAVFAPRRCREMVWEGRVEGKKAGGGGGGVILVTADVQGRIRVYENLFVERRGSSEDIGSPSRNRPSPVLHSQASSTIPVLHRFNRAATAPTVSSSQSVRSPTPSTPASSTSSPRRAEPEDFDTYFRPRTVTPTPSSAGGSTPTSLLSSLSISTPEAHDSYYPRVPSSLRNGSETSSDLNLSQSRRMRSSSFSGAPSTGSRLSISDLHKPDYPPPPPPTSVAEAAPQPMMKVRGARGELRGLLGEEIESPGREETETESFTESFSESVEDAGGGEEEKCPVCEFRAFGMLKGGKAKCLSCGNVIDVG